MQLRGPGDLLGVRQSGMLDFTLADIYTDAEVLQQANEAAGIILAEDPELAAPGHQRLRKHFNLLIRHQSDHLNL